MELTDKKILVVGMARSGISGAKLCKAMGAEVVVYDGKDPQQLIEKVTELQSEGIRCICGENIVEEIKDFDLLVLSPGVPTDLDFIEKAKVLNIPLWSEVELAYRYCKCPIIGITGTNGKTTTTSMVGQIIKAYKKDSQIVGNIGFPFTESVLDTKEDSFVVAELSSFQLETIDQFHCHLSAILNITPDHLNRHKTFENYISAKANIFKNSGLSDICILNYDDDQCRQLASKIPCKVVYFSFKHQIEDEGICIQNGWITVITKEESIHVCPLEDLKVLGDHNVENALAAVALCYYAKVPLEIIRRELTHFQGVEHRTEYVAEINGVRYYNDSKATNPDAAIKGLKAMQWPVVLIGGGMDKKSDFTEWIDHFDHVKELIVFGETAENIKMTAKRCGFTKVNKVQNLEEAVIKAARLAEKGDCVLLSPACASWDMFESFEQRGELFKKLVLQLKG